MTIPDLERASVGYRTAAARNIENYDGLAAVPVGIAGPVQITGLHTQGRVRVPLATTEATLVASTSRGMKLLNECGGVTTVITRGPIIQRAPVLRCESARSAAAIAADLSRDWAWMRAAAEQGSSHTTLVNVASIPQGRYLHLRLEMTTGDAAGQNMASVAAAACVPRLIARYPGIERVWMEGGLSGEKMPSPLNTLLGRGHAVTACADLPAAPFTTIIRADPEDLVEFFGIFANSVVQAGAAGTHASLINILAAIYIATGQDVASVPESSRAFNTIRYDRDQQVIHWEVTCPNLVLGTVGGGTGLPTQRGYLELMGCHGPGNAPRLAEICAATALANEISFWGAICADEWVAAHAARRTPGPAKAT